METEGLDSQLSVEPRQGYYGAQLGSNIGSLQNNLYGNLNQGANNGNLNGQNTVGKPWMQHGIAGSQYTGQAFSKRRFPNMGRYGNGGVETEYPTGLGNGAGLTGMGGDDGLNGVTSTGSDQAQSQDYLDSYNRLIGANLLSGSGAGVNGVGGQVGYLGGANNYGGGNINSKSNINSPLLVGSRRPYSATRRNGLGYGTTLNALNGGIGTGEITGYPSAYGGANGALGQLPYAGMKSSGYGGGSGYGGRVTRL